MSSPNIIQDTPQRHTVEYSRTERRLITVIKELALTFERMPKPPKAHTACICPRPQQPPDPYAKGRLNQLDGPSRMRASKVLNVFLFRLWRRRCAEVHDLHELVRKYQHQVNIMRDDLFLRNKMICAEQRRSERLEMELRKVKEGIVTPSHSCATIDQALALSQRQEAQLRQELQAKALECSNIAELLHETRREMFRELAKFRQCARELAEQQRANRILEIRNAELEDEIMMLNDRFDDDSQLEGAYKTLKGYEQELDELEFKHNELLRDNQSDIIMKEINRVQKAIGVVRYLMYVQWSRPYFKSFASEIVAKLLDYILQSPLSRPTLPVSSVGVYFAIMFLIGALC
ncbi:hypothetical protein KR222_007028 [Zaprionus bogoriensis]|nr:hypothetical protein KR222_007028 [Zaprionus bogoriensis]